MPSNHYDSADPSFGHVGPAVGLATNLLSLAPNVVITLLIPSGMHDATQHVLKRYNPDRSRLHVVFTDIDADIASSYKAGNASACRSSAPHTRGSPPAGSGSPALKLTDHNRTAGAFTSLPKADAQIGSAVKALAAAYTRLLNLQPLVDAITQTTAPSFAVPPHVAIIDVTIAAGAIAVLPKLNVAANVHVKLLCYSPLSAQWAMWSLVQTYDGDSPGYMERCSLIMDAPADERDAAYRRCIGESEDVIRVPGLPPTCESPRYSSRRR